MINCLIKQAMIEKVGINHGTRQRQLPSIHQGKRSKVAFSRKEPWLRVWDFRCLLPCHHPRGLSQGNNTCKYCQVKWLRAQIHNPYNLPHTKKFYTICKICKVHVCMEHSDLFHDPNKT